MVIEEIISGDSELMNVDSILCESVMVYGVDGTISSLLVVLVTELYCRLLIDW